MTDIPTASASSGSWSEEDVERAVRTFHAALFVSPLAQEDVLRWMFAFRDALLTLPLPPGTADREAVMRLLYESDPIYESGESIDGFQVSPGGDLTWEQFKDRCAEFDDDPVFHGWNDRLIALRSLADAIIAPSPQGSWQPISKAPRDGSAFWGYLDAGLGGQSVQGCIRWSSKFDGCWRVTWSGEDVTPYTVTYWQPLPNPPLGPEEE